MGCYAAFRLLVIVYLINLASGESSVTEAAAKRPTISDAQRAEIEKLKEDLNIALEKHDAESVAEGVIVQPKWTQDGTTDRKDSKVTVTAQGLKEAAALRAEINVAVSEDILIGSAGNATAEKNSTVKALEKEIDLQGREKKVSDSTLSSGLASKAASGYRESTDAEEGDEMTDRKAPNVADANDVHEPEIDVRKLQNLQISKRRTKEVLLLRSVEEDLSFTLGEDVKEWAHIWHGGEEYFIGRREIDLLIVHKEHVQYKTENAVNVGQPITCLESYSYWNSLQQHQEGVILVAAQDKVLWYRAQSDTGEVEKYWEWRVGTPVSGLTYFKVDSRDYLAVSLVQSPHSNVYALNIYAFELDSKEFWIAQQLRLQYACDAVTVLDTGRDLILAVPQNDTAAIYAFNPQAAATGHLHFQLLRTVETEMISHISGFQMGGRSYLALGGLKPKILLYFHGDFIPKTILGNNFGNVDLFFPIPIRTYRDDLILLVQHRVDFSTHVLTVLETLIWNGDSFETSTPVPCKIGVHTMYGVSCMLDVQRSEGLKGAALLRRGAETYMIVPRSHTESGLFHLKIEMLAKNSELLDLHEIQDFLQNWVLEQDELIKQAKHFLPPSAPDSYDFVSLKTPKLYFNGDIGELYVNNYKWASEDTNTDLDFVMDAIETLEHDLSQKRSRRDAVFDTKTFDSIEAVDVKVEDLIAGDYFIEGQVLDFDGLLNLQDLEILTPTISYRERTNERLITSSDVEFSEINGIRWSEISNNIILRNESVTLENLKVSGEIVAEDHLTVDVLNMLEFPDSFLWSSGPSTSTVNAEKIFESTLSANAVDTEGVINGVDPLSVITLSDAQEWNGMPTFASLEVSELFELNGTTLGTNANLLLASNPTLQENNTVLASCNFQHLEVLGFVDLHKNPDNIPLTTLLSDIIQPPQSAEDEIRITSEKRFATAYFPLDFNVLDAKINGMAINDFVRLHAKQELDISVLEGYIYFYHLNVTGLYDGVDIIKLNENSLKVHEPQLAANTHLNFVDVVRSDQFKIHKKLNGIPVAGGYQTISEDLQVTKVRFDDLNVETVNAPHDVHSTGYARLNGLNLTAYLETLAWTQPDEKRSISVDHLILANGLQTDEIHGINEKTMLRFLSKIDELPDMIFDGKVQVHHVIITGDVQLKNLNGRDFDEDIQLTAIWLNRPNYLSTSMQFEEPILHSDLNILGTYQEQNFVEFLADAIFFESTDDIYTVVSPKRFMKNVYVRNSTKLDAVNGIPFAKIATKNAINTFGQSLQLNRNLVAKDITIAGHFNTHPMLGLHRLIRYDDQLQSYVLLGEVPLRIRTPLEDLTVVGDANGVPNLSEFFENLVYRAQICSLKGNYTFAGRVAIENGAFIKQLNGLNLMKAFENIVLVNQMNPTHIRDSVVFKHAIRSQEIRVAESLATNNLHGCYLAEILRESIRLDRSCEFMDELHFVADSVDGNSLYASSLNGINLTLAITLHDEQHLPELLVFSELHVDGNIITEGAVNGANLSKEYENTLLVYGDQHVSTPLTLQTVTVLKNLNTLGLINGERDLKQVAQLDENLVLRTPLFFEHIVAHQLLTDHQVSGISLNNWISHALRLRGQSLQSISGNWSIRSLTVNTRGVANVFQTNIMPSYYRTPRAETDDSIGALCAEVQKALSQEPKPQSYIHYLEHKFNVMTPASKSQTGSQAFIIKWNQEDFLLHNIGCETLVYKWKKVDQAYDLVRSFASGRIDGKIIIIKRHNISAVEFLTNDVSPPALNCAWKGLNRWILDLKNLTITRGKAFGSNVTSMEASTANPDKLYTVRRNVLQRVDLNSQHVEQTWDLPSTDLHAPYRFVTGLYRMMLTNGRHITLITKDINVEMNSSSNHELVSTLHFAGSTQTELKPGASIRQPNFSDFTQIVAHILTDLIYRLHLQVNITQLSIPESDLYDEHLAQDFIAIVQELQQQNIYSNQTFKDLDFTALKLPSSPAQVLAIRAVQVIWPVIKEIEEIHNYHKDHNGYEHPISSCIINHLGVMVKEVLVLFNGDETTHKESGDDSTLHRVITRIRKFQKLMAEYADTLYADIKRNLNPHNAPELGSTDAHLGAARWKTFSHSNASKVLYVEKSHLPAPGRGEIVRLEVGSKRAPQIMFAVNSYEAGSIKLYSDILQPHLFQTISVQHARSIVSMRIRSQTLLAYIADCCGLHVMIYRGVEGFKEIARFKASSRVDQLIFTSLPTDGGGEQLFLAVVLERKIAFYEVKVDGLQKASQLHLKCQ